MTTVSPVTNAAAAPPPLPEDGTTNERILSSDFETFLKMLTTQLENQDPLNPLDATDFAVQLATFSGVEQQVRTNDLLQSLAGAFGSGGMSQFAGWVGMEVRAPTTVEFAGGSAQITAPVLPNVDKAMLAVKNADSQVVGRVDIANDGAPFTWLGTGDDGKPLDWGTYTFAVEGYVGQARTTELPVESYSLVSEVQTSPDGPVLILGSGQTVAASTVSAVRAGP